MKELIKKLTEITKIGPTYYAPCSLTKDEAQTLLNALQSKGKTKEEVWEEVQSYHQIEGTIPEGSRVEAALFQAMEEYAQSYDNQDGWVSVEAAIKSRINWFEKHYHSFEANELKAALSSIERLVPPSMYKHEPQP